jgi:hypothetical protein
MQLPRITNYGEYSSDNYGVNSLRVEMPTFTVWYSYKTIVAYHDKDDGFVIRKNDWDTTTGKHLNWIDPDKSLRIDGRLFEQKLEAMIERHTQ